jgi:hypothetical protein
VKPNTYGTTGSNTYKPQANRTTSTAGQNFNRGSYGGGNGVFGSNSSRGFDRTASQRGGNSMRSAQHQGFRPKFQ